MAELKKGEFFIILVIVLIVSIVLSFFIINFSNETQTYKIITSTGGSNGVNPIGITGSQDTIITPCPCL